MSAEHPYLVLETNGGERFLLKDPTTLGRTQNNDLALADAGCSSRHAVIRQDRGVWIIEDLGSTNGTWIDDERIAGIRVLQEGDLIQIGGQSLRVQGLPVELRCARCGAVSIPEAAFCPTCGMPLKEGGPSATVMMPPRQKPVASPTPDQVCPAPGPQAVLAPLLPPAGPRPEKKKGRLGLVGAAVLVALLLLSVPVVFFWPRISGLLRENTSALLGASAAGQVQGPGKRPLAPKFALFREALLFRKAASSSNLPRIIRDYEGTSALGFLLDSKTYKDAPALWSYFFSGAIVLGGCLESPNPVMAYYNPFLDGVLLTQWELKEGRARLVAADLRIASRMAGQSSANPNLAWWLSAAAKRPIPVVLKEQYATFARAFGRDFPVDSSSSVRLNTSPDVAEVRTILERQAMASFINLANFQNPKSPVFHSGLATLKQAVRSGDAALLAKLLPGNNPMKAQTIAAQPGWGRQSAVPMYAMAGATKTIFLLAPSDAPRYYLLASWTNLPAPRLEVLAPYDMDGSVPLLPKRPARSEVKS